MRIYVQGNGLPMVMKYYAEMRAWGALERFSRRVLWMTVRLEDCNGPRGGVDKRCRMEVWLDRAGLVLTEHTAADIRSAVDGAAVRLKQKVSRQLKQRWQSRRRSAIAGQEAVTSVPLELLA